jgi:serine/threonine protein kinase
MTPQIFGTLGILVALAAPASATDVTVGAARYTLDKKLGNGAWSDTYAAHDGGGKRVAIKVFKDDRVRAGTKDTFDKESSILKKANEASAKIHKSSTLSRSFGVGHVEGGDERRAFVMDFAAGDTLKAHPVKLSAPDAVKATMQVLRGVRALELVGMQHNDIHGGNVIMKDGKPETMRLLDVGNASEAARGKNNDLKKTTDLMYKLIVGADTPKPGSDGAIDLSKIPDARAKVDGKEVRLRDVMARGLDQRADKRFANAAAYLDALRPFAH